jgi:uncharacterized protein with PIN domain
MEYSESLCFVADSTLGKLTKWLRLLGFDTRYDSRCPDIHRLHADSSAGRLVLTRSRSVAENLSRDHVLFIKSDYPIEQMRQLIDELHLTANQIQVFSRCSICNTVLDYLEKTEAEGLVPDYIYQTQTTFKRCSGCQRIYWPGSHGSRWLALTSEWFGS